MNVEIGAEAALFPEKEYINGIAAAVYWFLNFQNDPLMRYRQCHFPRGLGENIWQKKHILERHLNFLCCSRRFLLIDWLNSRFKLVHSSSSNVFFKIAERPLEDRREKVKLVCSPRISFACPYRNLLKYS